jgi:protein ImuB
MLWACLHFSDLPLRAVFDTDELRQRCAIIDGPRQRPLIVAANEGAQQAGVRRQHVLAAARAICADLRARARDTAAEHRLLHSLAAWAYRFSSHVSLSQPDALLIEVGASLRLFGGWPALQRQLRTELAELEFHPAIAVTPLPAAARVLARRHDGFFAAQPEAMLDALADVPIAQADLPEATITLLYRVGFARLRDVFALPRPELARRIGPESLLLLDRLRGLEADVLPLYRPPDAFAHRIELDDRVDAWPPLLFPLRRLCGELALFLAARDGGVQRCELVFDHENRTVTRVAIELLTPQREARSLYELIRSRLERVALTQPVCGFALIAKDLPTFKPQHQDLFEPKRAQALDWPELAERLRAHLGDEGVRGLAQTTDHRPEKAWRFETAVAKNLPPEKKFSRRAGAGSSPLPLGRCVKEQTHESPSPLPANSSPLPLEGEVEAATAAEGERRMRERTRNMDSTAALQAAMAKDSSTGKPARSSPLPLAGEVEAATAAEGERRMRERTRSMDSAAAPQARVRVAFPKRDNISDNATSRATLTPTLSEASHESIPAAPSARYPVSPLADARDVLQGIAQAHRPLWLLHRAIPLRGPAPQILAGPERIESGWWDGGDTRRDYYVVRTREGQRAWAYLPAGEHSGWMLHGWFA